MHFSEAHTQDQVWIKQSESCHMLWGAHHAQSWEDLPSCLWIMNSWFIWFRTKAIWWPDGLNGHVHCWIWYLFVAPLIFRDDFGGAVWQVPFRKTTSPYMSWNPKVLTPVPNSPAREMVINVFNRTTATSSKISDITPILNIALYWAPNCNLAKKSKIHKIH